MYERLVSQFSNAGRYWKIYIEHEVRPLFHTDLVVIAMDSVGYNTLDVLYSFYTMLNVRVYLLIILFSNKYRIQLYVETLCTGVL